MPRLLTVAAALCSAAVGPTSLLLAQSSQASLSVGGGMATDQRGVRSNAFTVAPSLLLVPDPRVSLGIAGSATRFEGSGWAAGASAKSGVRLPIGGPFSLAGSAAAGATRTSFDATYLTAEATPTLEAAVRRVTLFAGLHAASGSSSVRESSASPLPSVPTSSRTVQRSLGSVGPVFGAVLGLPTERRDAGGALSYREEHARVGTLTIIDRTAGAGWNEGRLSLAASLGARSAPDEQVSFGSTTATMGVTRTLAVQASAGSYPSTRILGTLGGRYASLGLVLRGRTHGALPERADAVRGAPPVPAGATRLTMREPSASRVELAGDWNQWATTPAIRGADGRWYVDVRLPRGEYRYAFRVNGERWTVPDDVPTVDDGFGGRSALLTVR